MDNAYTIGFDYDTYRQKSFSVPLTLYVEKKNSSPLLVILMVVAILLVGLYALRFVPLFDINEIEFILSKETNSAPIEAIELAQNYIGSSHFSLASNHLKKELASLEIVESVKKEFSLFGKERYHLKLKEVELLLIDSTKEHLFGIVQGKIIALDMGNLPLFGVSKRVVELSNSYLEHIREWGLDEQLLSLIALAKEVGFDERGHFPIIGDITYHRTSFESFGTLSFTLPAYNSTLSVRGEFEIEQLQKALKVIKFEWENSKIHNIALTKQLRYDLYSQSVVKRL